MMMMTRRSLPFNPCRKLTDSTNEDTTSLLNDFPTPRIACQSRSKDLFADVPHVIVLCGKQRSPSGNGRTVLLRLLSFVLL